MWPVKRPTTEDAADLDYDEVDHADVEHTHDPAVRDTYSHEHTFPRSVGERREAVTTTTGPSVATMVARVIVVLGGAGVLIAGAMLDWVKGMAGTSMSGEAFYRTQMGGGYRFMTSAGVIVIGLAVLALIGLAGLGAWLTRLAGALGIVAFPLFVIQAVRANVVNTVSDIQIGMWLVLAGGFLALIGGLIGGWRTGRWTMRRRNRADVVDVRR
jgi:uncharacterized membrane protein YidH (DUF202 family)